MPRGGENHAQGGGKNRSGGGKKFRAGQYNSSPPWAILVVRPCQEVQNLRTIVALVVKRFNI